MIRKGLAFLLLLSLGIWVLISSIGWDQFIAEGGEGGKAQGAIQERKLPETEGRFTTKTSDDTVVNVRISGPFELPIEERTLPQPDGSAIVVPLYRIRAEDSRPREEDGLYLLETVTVDLYDIRTVDGRDEGFVAGILKATEAVLEMGVDAKGRRSIQADRDIELTNVQLVSLPGASMEDLELEVEKVRIREENGLVTLRTDTPDRPFDLRLGGRRPLRMTGRGLDAVLPDRGADGDPAPLEIRVVKDPVLESQGQRLRARGAMEYRERSDGSGTVIVEDDVYIDVQGGLAAEGGAGSGSPQQEATVHGDRLVGRLLRGRSRRDGPKRSSVRAGWSSLLITDEPGGLERVQLEAQGVLVRCDRLAAIPGIDGQPFLFSAGGSPELSETGGRGSSPSSGAVFRADQEIHLVRLAPRLAPIHEALTGVPQRSLGRLSEQLVLFEGRSEVDEPSRGLRLEATEGMRLFRSAEADADDAPVLVLGSGDVSVSGKAEEVPLTVTGNRGFTLRQQGERLRLRLGPVTADASHAFQVQRGGEAPITATGHGLCSMDLVQGRTGIAMESPEADLVLAFPDGTLRDARRLDATVADGAIENLVAEGGAAPCAILYQSDPEDPATRISGKARRIRSGDGRSFTLSDPDDRAELRRGEDILALGEQIYVLRRPGKEFDLEIRRRATIELASRVAADEQRDLPAGEGRTRLDADWVDLRQDVVSREQLLAAARLSGLPRAGSRSRRVLLAGGPELRLQQFDGATGERVLDGRGQLLMLQVEQQNGFLQGSPANLLYVDRQGRLMHAFARKVLLQPKTVDGQDSMDLVLLDEPGFDPELRMRAPDRAGAVGDLRHLRVRCEGPIRATEQEVLFEGAVDAVRIDDAGTPDPTGLSLKAKGLRAVRGESDIESLAAEGDCDLMIRGIRTRSDKMLMNALSSTLTVQSSPGDAVIDMPGGEALRTPQLVLNYVTRTFQIWRVRTNARE